jgi:hypothetical protein
VLLVVTGLLAQVGARLVDAISQIVGQRHAGVGWLRLVTDDGHLRIGIGIAQGLRCDDAGGTRPDDDVMHALTSMG